MLKGIFRAMDAGRHGGMPGACKGGATTGLPHHGHLQQTSMSDDNVFPSVLCSWQWHGLM